MPSIEQLIPWLTRLTNLAPDRTQQAVREVRSWNLGHLTQELLDEPDLDTLVAAVLLAEGINDLHAQGAERTKLMKKIRDARSPDQLWATWAEIRGASALINAPQWDVQLELEPDKAKGRHSDFRAHFSDGYSVDIEFKAVGLSDADVEWHRRAGEQFESLLPPWA